MALEIDDIVRIALTGTGAQATIWQNVWHYKMTAGAGVDEAAFLTAVAANVDTTFLNIDQLLSDEYSFDQIEGWKYNFSTSKWNGIGTNNFADKVGLSASDPVAHGVAAVGRFVTQVARRQGRTFLPGLIEGAIDDGLLDATTLAAFALYMADFTNNVLAGGGTFKLCTFNTDAQSIYFETSAVYVGPEIISAIPGYQRRRKPLVGI